MRVPQFIAITWLALLCTLTTAHAEKRVALVIGNDRYANLPANEQLQKAVSDARAIGGSLRQIGFDVISGENLDRRALNRKLSELNQRVGPGDTAFFFFSGHGVAVNNINYILPADVPAVGSGRIASLTGAAIKEEDITERFLGVGARVAVVVLDACRDNPFARPGARSVGGERGLASPPQVKGVFSLYAASAGQGARDQLSDDDRNPNSVFTRVLAPLLKKPGLDLRDLAYEVREEVARLAARAGYEQWPACYDGMIGGRVYLAGLPPGGDPRLGGGDAPVADAIVQNWKSVQDTTSIEALEAFKRRHPSSFQAELPDLRIAALKRASSVPNAEQKAVSKYSNTQVPHPEVDASWLNGSVPSR